MSESILKIRTVKEKDWQKEHEEYLRQIEIASAPIKRMIEGLINDCTNTR